MITKRVAVVAFLMALCLALPTFAQQSKTVTKGPLVIKEFKHDTGPILREIEPLLPEWGTPPMHEIDNKDNPNRAWDNQPVVKDPVLQTAENSPTKLTPTFNLEFDGIGFGSAFFCNCMPPDNDGAPGLTQYVQYVNLTYQVFDKSGNTLMGPLAGNSFWSGFGGSCQSDNSGDPIVRFDAAAQRWVVSQFAINGSAPDFECVAVSTTSDATGSYNRYAFSTNNFPDYPKMSVWPDAYYFTFNNFTISGSSFLGASACAADRTQMLAGGSATMQCFPKTLNSANFGMLPSDLDGATPPAAGTPNFIMELDPDGSAHLSMFAFHVDFVNPSNSTFTGPTLIPVSAFTAPCPSTRACVPQPGSSVDKLDGLGTRLMFRMPYRNFGDHTTLLVSHSIVASPSIGVRWYEIHNPETSPTVFQSGTFAPDSSYRWMPSVAMDQSQDIAIGYSKSSANSGDFPSVLYNGRVPSDPAGTLETEVILKQGTGSQASGGFDRWGDYSSMTVDPVDDCTFWVSNEYIKVTGQNSGFNWSTAIGSFIFPGCGGGGTPDFSLSANPTSVTITQGNSGTSTITVNDLNGFSGNVTLSASGLPSGVTAGFSPNPTATSSTLTLTASGTAATGTVTVTITGVSGALTHTTTVQLTVNPAGSPDFSLSANPTSVTITQGTSGTSTITVNDLNGFSGNVTLSASGLPSGVTAGFSPNPTATTSTLTLTASGSAATGTVTVTITGVSGALTHTTTVQLTVNPAGGGPVVTLTPTSLSFGTVVLGSTSKAKTVTLANTGTGTLNISSITISGSDYALVPSTKPCGATLAAGANCKIAATFTPSQVGLRTGTITITDNAANSPQTVPLSGTGKAQATLTPATATYASQTVGTTSAAKTFTLKNNLATTLTGVTLSTTGDFAISQTFCGSTLAAGGSCTVSVTFTPTQTGTRTGTLQASDSANNSPQVSNLKGTGK